MLGVNDLLHRVYRIEAVREQTALRTVYLAQSIRTQQRVSISEFRVPAADAEQFTRQLEALIELRHPNLPRVLGEFVENNLHYLVTEAVAGVSLSDQVKAGLPTKDAIHYILQMADALEHCHQVGIIHRDVRPENIIVDPKTNRAMLVNFGLMKLMLEQGSETVQFVKGWAAPHYAAPEQYSVGTDARSDIYALGATAYYALTQQHPVPAPERIAGEAMFLPGSTLRGGNGASSTTESVPPHVTAAIEKAMSLATQKRFATARDFRQAMMGRSLAEANTPTAATVTPVRNTQSPVHFPSQNERATLKENTARVGVVVSIGVVALIALIGIAVVIMRLVSAGLGEENPSLASAQATPTQQQANAAGANAGATLTPQFTSTLETPLALPATVPSSTPLATFAPTLLPTSGSSEPTPGEPTAVQPAPTAVVAAWTLEAFEIGQSVQNRPLVVYKLGNGPVHRALIGAIHGGYEWNTAKLMSETLDFLRRNPQEIPSQLTLYILPVANPDGYATSTDRFTGRPNANGVDLNRNWDFNWQMTATHGTRPVSAGRGGPFSEPETVALRDFITGKTLGTRMESVIFYHSAFTAVFQGTGISNTQTTALATLYANAARYRFAPEGVPGQITTGDAIDYLTAKEGITAIEVELRNHEDTDWDQNLRALRAYFKWNLPAAAPAQPGTPSIATTATTPGGGNSSATCSSPYVVQPYDTISEIALKCNVDADELMRLNGISDPTTIQPNQELKLPGQAPTR